MRRYAAISALFHVAIVVIAWFGVPDLFRRDLPEDQPLIVEVLPISSITNAPPPKPEPPKVVEAPKPPEPKPEPPKVEPPKPEPPKVVETPKPPEPKPPPPPPPPPPPVAAPPPPAPAPVQRAEAPLPRPPKARPEQPKPVKQAAPPVEKPQKQQKQQAFDLNNMLRDLTRQKPQPQQTPQQQQAQAPAAPRAASNAPHNPNIPLSMTEEDAIRQRIVQNWNLDIGAKGIETFFVELQLIVAPDGTVQDARIVRTQGDPADALRAFAEGARRAALKSSPLPLPPTKASQMTGGNLYLTFSARDMLGSAGRRS
jgi:hypothetical protein